jgi:DNA-binding IclR family transcriptional regulator
VKRSIPRVGVLDKALRVLEALEDGPLALGELAPASRLPRATAWRLAAALEGHGLVRRDAEGRFGLGHRLAALARAASRAVPLAETAAPALAELRRATGESVQLYVREGERRVCVAALESPHGLRTIVALGAALPLDRGSAGKVLREDAAALARGFAESVGEREPGVASVSAPVRDADGRIVAAVSVSGPIERTSRAPGRRYAKEVVRAARAIERALRSR